MRHRLLTLALLAPLASAAVELPSLPVPVTNNAVTAVETPQGNHLYTFGGLLEGKTWADTTARAWTLAPGAEAWVELPPVPEGEGRLAAVATTVAGRAYVFGGYTVAEDGEEASLPYVHSIAPGETSYRRHADMPVPVDDMVAIPYLDRYIYLVSGWHDLGNVNLVQLYDTQTDSWTQARPWPGPAVFGHAGGMTVSSDGATVMVICDGVKVLPEDAEGPRRFVMSDYCARGEIDPEDPRRIAWTDIGPHPGAPRYRMAAMSAWQWISFTGGSETAYNYEGVGYDGSLAEPAMGRLVYDVDTNAWRLLEEDTPLCAPRMDLRGAIPGRQGSTTLIGGMLAGRVVTDSLGFEC